MTVSVREAVTALESKGFRRARSRDHRYFFYWTDGKKTAIHAKISHGAREIDSFILGKLKKSLRLDTNSQASDLLVCPMTASDYLRFLTRSGRL